MKVLKKIIVIIITLISIQAIGIITNRVMAASGRINVELPRQNEVTKGEVSVNGWALSEDKNAYIQILLDGRIIGTATRYERVDVLNSIPGYGGKNKNPMPGFDYKLNLTNVEEGNHILAARIVSGDNRVITIQDVSIFVKKYDCRLAVEIPNDDETIKNTVKINGWALSEDREDKIIVKVDGKMMGTAKRYERQDVLNAIHGYGGKEKNPKPGFDIDINTSTLKEGYHTILVELRNKQGELMTAQTKRINVSRTYRTLLNLEIPRESQTEKTNVKVNGWLMCEDKNAIIEVLLDNNKIENQKVERYIRPDVLYSIKGYGGKMCNPAPGYNIDIDTKNIKDGKHKITLNVKSETGELLATESRNINIHKYEGKLNLEKPSMNQIGKTKIEVNGWAMSEDKNDKILVYIDNKEYSQANRYERQDVLNAVLGYGGKNANEKPGFDSEIDVTKLSEGNHTVTVKIISSFGDVIREDSRVINVSRNFDSRLNFELPTNNSKVKEKVIIDGWVISEDDKANLQVLVDGKSIEHKIDRYKREDVLAVIPGYGGKETNPTPGFHSELNITDLKDGYHTITIRLVSQFNKILAQQDKKILIHKYDSRLLVEQPKVNQNVKNTVKINGWALSEDKDDIIEIRMDNKIVGQATRYERNDIFKVVSGYGGKEKNSAPGYNFDLKVSNLKDGKHTLTVNIVASKTKEIINSQSIPINIRKYEGIINIETPTENKNLKNDFEVTGWEMSETIATVKLYIDGADFSNLVKREERIDVTNSIHGYGGKETNPTPGFSAKIPANKLKPGTHTIIVKILSSLGDIIATQNRKIYLYTSALHGIDVSVHNGNINWKQVKDSGIDFAIIRCGYGKNDVSQDDAMFSRNIAECERLGIPYGVYLYSYAGDRAGARSEAEHVLRLIGNKKPICGIWIDIEDADEYKKRNGIPYETGVEVADEFCTIMKSKGYSTGIYASLSWLNGPLKDPLLDKYDKWVAQWNDVCEYGGKYVMWQYTSSGTVSGITGNVDMNLWFKKMRIAK